MRLAFRKVDFGDFGIKDGKQFVYPSLVRLGKEANTLLHLATNSNDETESLSTYSFKAISLGLASKQRRMAIPGIEGRKR